MIFNTPWFLGFFVVFYLILWAVPNNRLRLLYLLGMSAVFHYHFAGPAGVTPIILMAVVTYGMARWIHRFPAGSAARERCLWAGLAVPVTALLSYKYRALIMGTAAGFVGGRWSDWLASHAVNPALPLAISFFTFEFVHYLSDVAKGSEPIRDPIRFSVFTIFFPSIVSGPIKRFQPFLAQVEKGLPRPTSAQALSGLHQVVRGFLKKLVVADNATLAAQLLQGRADRPGSVALLAAVLSIRILLDFSGYSDIAIGLGRMIGLELPANFNFPYIASNLQDFWRRWHMSLSSWIRDYLYIPLGGSRQGSVRKLGNLSLAMFICGLWHGPQWHFGIWGLYHGFGLAAHSVWDRSAPGKRVSSLRGARWAGIIWNNAFVAYGWLWFFYPTEDVLRYTKALIGFH